jgi:hypothetical protein
VFKLAQGQQAPAQPAAAAAQAAPVAKPVAAKVLAKAAPKADAKPGPALKKVEAQPAANRPAPKAKVANARTGAGDEWEEF